MKRERERERATGNRRGSCFINHSLYEKGREGGSERERERERRLEGGRGRDGGLEADREIGRERERGRESGRVRDRLELGCCLCSWKVQVPQKW